MGEFRARIRLMCLLGLILTLPGSLKVQAAPPPSGSSWQQPFENQVRRLQTALQQAGQPLSSADQAALRKAAHDPRAIQAVLDRYVLINVTISPESRVDVKHGAATPGLVQNGTRLFLVKVINQAGVTAPLAVESPNSGLVYFTSTAASEPKPTVTMNDVRERWADISFDTAPPLEDRLSGIPVEYQILSISSRDAGQRTATLNFNVGEGTQDVGFRSSIAIPFRIAPAHSIKLQVLDQNGKPTMASFIFRDRLGRIYPAPTKRIEPDFYFQPQVYRRDGESIELPPGAYTATYTGGPEFLAQKQSFVVSKTQPASLSFQLNRWINPADQGWYSGDDHIHSAGCSHYESPTQGVDPTSMNRQVLGEHLDVGAVLVWGPCFYYQSQFFRGRHDDPASGPHSVLHYDLEVSGFPSSHAGHLVLLDLSKMIYPGTSKIEQWPTWDLPILRWAKSQRATVGFAHSGFGLAVGTDQLPNYEVPGFDSIGANEYIVDVTYPNTVDFISAGNTPYVWELNIWYHTLNVGFRTKLSGETDFPCMYDGRVGQGRTYAGIQGPLTYDSYIKAVHAGNAYVSDGRSHLMNLKVEEVALGSHNSEVDLDTPRTVHVKVDAAAYLPPQPENTAIRQLPYNQKPYWDLERARIGATRKVPVEVVVNGEPVAKTEIVADGSIQKLDFPVSISKSSWLAVRILPSSHSNPMFVLVGGKPIRASRRSAEWCLRGVKQCWSQKSPKISAQELPEAKKAYDHATEVYTQLLKESADQE
jgi:hypothetical protein